jgi:hypothetical protein
MKKILITLTFCLSFFLHAKAQDATKAETMDWIASKLQKYLVKKPIDDSKFEFREFRSYTDGKFLYKRNYEDDNENDCGYRYITIDLNNVSGYDRRGDWFEIKGNNLISELTSRVKCGAASTMTNTTTFNLSNTTDDNLFELNLEMDLFNRMEKALTHLIKLNTKKSGEKF